MKLTQHGNNMWQVTRFAFFNNYLVREEDGLTLIDANMSGSQKTIMAAAETIGLPITRITLTHAHGDHVGSLDEVAALLPGVEVAFTSRTAEFLQGNRELSPDEPQAKLRGSFMNRSTKATRLLEPGDMLGSLRVVAAPGHTPDHIAFWDERDGTLIARFATNHAYRIAPRRSANSPCLGSNQSRSSNCHSEVVPNRKPFHAA